MANYAVIIMDKNINICDHDAYFLENLLKNRKDNFPHVKLYGVADVSDLLVILNKVREINFSQISTLWVFLFVKMAGKRLILNQKICSSVIFNTFSEEVCPTLRNKPKVFVLQGLDQCNDNINPLIMDYCKTENIEIPLPYKPGVLIFMHKVRGRSCSDNKTCLFKAFEKRMAYKTNNTELINLFRLVMSAIDASKNAPTPPFLFSTIMNMTTLEQPASQDPLFHYPIIPY